MQLQQLPPSLRRLPVSAAVCAHRPAFHDQKATVKKVALSQFPRCWQVKIRLSPHFSGNARPILTERLACFEQNNTGFDMNQILGPGDEVNKTVSLTSMSGEAAAFLSLSSSAC